MAIDTVVAKLRKRIQDIRDRKETIGEENTKATLIEPLLSALGWDVEELEEVRREYRRKAQDKPVDYALFLVREPRLFIEAKALNEDLTNRKWASQILGYATVVGVRWCVLTDGDEYRLYNAHAEVDIDESFFVVFVFLSLTKASSYTRYRLWRWFPRRKLARISSPSFGTLILSIERSRERSSNSLKLRILNS